MVERAAAAAFATTTRSGCVVAARLYPAVQRMVYGSRGGALDGRADALLLAEFVRRTHRVIVDDSEIPF